MTETKIQTDRWQHASAAFKAERPWCGWTLAFGDNSDWDTARRYGLDRLANLNILLTTADGRSRPVRIVETQYIDEQYDEAYPRVDDPERKAGIEVLELDTDQYEPINRDQRERVPYEDIREIVVF